MDFLSQSDSSGGDFFKLNAGDKRSVRIISKPLAGFETWVDNMPVRWGMNDKQPPHAVSDERPKRFVSFVVYEYKTADGGDGAVKVWTITQRTIKDQLKMLSPDGHWGSFELVVVRHGTGLDTKYNITGIKSQPEPALVEFAVNSAQYIDLSKILEGDSPFLSDLPAIHIDEANAAANDLPF